jgi:GNAT superfamily N-acetyltransferase
VTDRSIEEYQTADEPEVLALMKSALGESATLPRTSGFWHWKHFENPFGPSLILVARIDREIAGLRAYLRWRFVSPAGPVQAMRAVDTATRPEHQRQGIFRALTLEANRRAAAEGMDLIFNTPNRQSLPGYVSMGWSVVGKPRIYVRVSRPIGMVLRSGLSGPADPMVVIPGGRACRFDESVGDRRPLGLRTARSAEYLRWRFERHPTVPYRMIDSRIGTLVARPNHRAGRVEVVVSEVLGGTSPPRSERRVVAADYLVGSARPASPEAGAFVRSGFLPAPGLGPTLVALPLTEPGRMALSLAGWDLSAGDLELM